MKHGTASGYINHGCRCPACTKANTEKTRSYRSRIASVLSGRDGTTPGNQSVPASAGTDRGHGNQEVRS